MCQNACLLISTGETWIHVLMLHQVLGPSNKNLQMMSLLLYRDKYKGTALQHTGQCLETQRKKMVGEGNALCYEGECNS